MLVYTRVQTEEGEGAAFMWLIAYRRWKGAVLADTEGASKRSQAMKQKSMISLIRISAREVMLGRRRRQSEKTPSQKMGKRSLVSEATDGTDRCNLLHLRVVCPSNCSSWLANRLILAMMWHYSELQEIQIGVWHENGSKLA